MRGFKNIVVPLDFSESTSKILESTVRVAAEEAEVTLLHVVEWLPQVTQATFGIYPHRKDIDKIKELSRAKLQECARTHPEHPMKVMVREGKPASTILEAVRDVSADMVVMGTHGRSRLDHLLIGSVAERVSRKAPCSVLLVRTDEP